MYTVYSVFLASRSDVAAHLRITTGDATPTTQNSYSLLNRTNFETDLAEVCSPRHTNVGLMAYSPLAGGSLTGKYIDGTPEGARFTLFPGYMDRFNKSLAKDAVAEYVAVRAHH